MATSPETDPRLPEVAEGTSNLAVFAATRLEAWAARRALPRGIAVERIGVGLRGWAPPAARPFVSCGLAGALSESLTPGTIVVPEWVGLPSGDRVRCHPPLVEALVAASRMLGREPVTAPLITTSWLVTGRERQDWSAKGFVAADMETGLLLNWHSCGAAVRVVLDSPQRDLSATWERPWRALLEPLLWPQAFWIGLTAPTYALRAAAVVRAATALTSR
jgi:hypothetical protein